MGEHGADLWAVRDKISFITVGRGLMATDQTQRHQEELPSPYLALDRRPVLDQSLTIRNQDASAPPLLE